MTAEAQTLPFTVARLYGEELTDLPADLYIPPEALEIFLEAFEGPLDLLLYLIRRQNFNILDIPMAELTVQYLAYVEKIRQSRLELAAEYLVMAAMLVEIKSRLLLPVHRDEESPEEDPRAELVERLLEYERIKKAAGEIDRLPQIHIDFFTPSVAVPDTDGPKLPTVTPEALSAAFAAIVRRAKLNAQFKITRQELSVREHMTIILRKLREKEFTGFFDLFDATTSLESVVVHFLALLELARNSFVELTQENASAPIYVRLTSAPD